MKKLIVSLVLIVSLLMTSLVAAGTINTQGHMQPITVTINGERVSFEPGAMIVDGRTLVPLRGVFEKLGAHVDWNKETNQVVVKEGSVEVLLEVGNLSVLVNGELKQLDVPSMLIDNRTLVPVRFITEALGHEVKWDAANKQVNITSRDRMVDNERTELPVVGTKEALYELLKYNNSLYSYIHRGMMTIDMSVTTESTDGAVQESAPSSPDANKSSEAETTGVGGGDDHSSTNVQTEGVDEGDIIKTNGKHIFSLSENQVYIVDPTPASPTVLSQIKFTDSEGYASDIYVQENRLVVLGTKWVYDNGPILREKSEVVSEDFRIMPIFGTSTTFVKIYDVSNPSSPVLTSDKEYEGNYASSRLIGDKLYVITNKGIQTWYQEITPMPYYKDNLSGEVTEIGYEEIRYFPDYVAPNYLITVGIDLVTGASNVETYLGSAEIVYASLDNLFLAFNKYEYTPAATNSTFMPTYETSTTIYKFKLENGRIVYQNSGMVKGSALNQYALDEHNGYLRIATTSGDMWDENNISKNNIFILNENLIEVGSLTGLAEGERIYSTRFAGNRIYMVTFRQVDPFFVIDATDPTAPKVLGDLKIPGFSTYMHVLDDNHVLGFGSDTIEEEGRVTTGGLKISLFDVTNPEAPIESQKEIIGKAGTYSEIQYNPKALMISLSKGIMAFPISVVGSTPYVYDFTGAYVYNLSNSGFSYKGNMTHHDASTLMGEGQYQYYDYRYNINRVIYIGDYLYSISLGKLQITDLNTMTTTGTLEFK